jgi:hypothetical protein
MAEQDKDALTKSVKFANMLMGVGMLLTIVPTGLAAVSIIISGDASFWSRLASLGWAFFVTALLLPIGLALLFFGFGKMAALKRALKALDEADD